MWREDFIAFAATLDIVGKDGQRTKLRANAIQASFEVTRSGRDIVLKPRQVGFTTWELARDVWFFLTRPGAQVVIVCQSMADDAAIKQISSKLGVMFDSLRAEGIALEFGTETTTQWTLPAQNASLKIVGAGASEASAAKKGRSGTITRLHITESAFFEYAETTLNAILECVPGVEFGTEIVIESTANGASGHYFEQYQGASGIGYRSRFFAWFEQPEYRTALDVDEELEPETPRERELVERHDISPEQLKWYRQKVAEKGQDLTDQEYPSDSETCFLVAGRCFFDRTVTKALLAIAQATAPILSEHDGELRIWKHPEAGKDYVISVDPSEGMGGDPGAAEVYERKTGEHVATLHGQFTTWDFGIRLARLGTVYNTALIVIERNNHGNAVLDSLSKGQGYTRIYRDQDGKLGWNSTETSRSAALDALEHAHSTGQWASPDVRVISEQRTFVVGKSGKAEAAKGAHDDLIMAAAVGWDVMRKPGINLVSSGNASYRMGGAARGY